MASTRTPAQQAAETSECVTTGQKAVSAIFGAVLTNLFATPLDVVKTRMQTGVPAEPPPSLPSLPVCCKAKPAPATPAACARKASVCRTPASCAVACVEDCQRAACRVVLARQRLQGSTLGTMVHIARSEGVRSLWSGLSPALVMAVPSTALYFTAYDELKLRLEGRWGDQGATGGIPVAALTAGALARTAAATVISPLELIRTKMQSRASTLGIWASIRADVRQHGGVGGLWRGLGPTLLRDVPFSAMYWGGYEACKRALAPVFLSPEEAAPSALSHFCLAFACGSISGSLAAFATTPFDVVKTQRQAALYGLSAAPHAAGPVTTNTWAILRNILAREGLGGWFVGLMPRVAKVAPACAIMISSYELGKLFFAEAVNDDVQGDWMQAEQQ